MNILKQSLNNIKLSAWALIPILFLYESLDAYINMRAQEILSSPSGLSSWIWAYGLLSLASSLIFPCLGTLLILWAIYQRRRPLPLAEFLHHFFEQSLIETLRSWGKILIRLPLLVFPAIYAALQYSLLIFVVSFDESYDAGKVDALEKSKSIFNKYRWRIFLILASFHFVIPLILTAFFDAYRIPWQTPIASLALVLLDAWLLSLSTEMIFQFVWLKDTAN